MLKSEIRISKFETNPKNQNSKSQYRNPKQTHRQMKSKLGKSKTLNSIPPIWSIVVVLFFIILNLFRISNFDIRIFVI